MATTLKERLRTIIAPAVESAGFDLEDVAVTAAGRRRLVRVTVDGDGGVSLDDVAAISQAISTSLDEDDALGAAPYVLEVSSPGVDRPLTEPRHFRRAQGRLVSFVLTDGAELAGRIVEAGGAAVAVRTSGDGSGDSTEIPYATILRARMQVEFGPVPIAGEHHEREDA